MSSGETTGKGVVGFRVHEKVMKHRGRDVVYKGIRSTMTLRLEERFPTSFQKYCRWGASSHFSYGKEKTDKGRVGCSGANNFRSEAS